jgi:hypothetical protein
MAQSFAEGWATGLQIANLTRQRDFEQSIDDAGKLVQDEIQKEKDFKAQQRQLVESSKPVDTMSAEPVNPSVYQQGDSIGLRGYQVGNKPIQTTVPTAPPGYMSRPGEEVTPGIDTNGYYEPEPNTSANPATAQTLIGNYGTTASFKGEKPTAEDTSMMQKDLQRPFNGPQDNSVLDLAQIKPETTPQEAVKPKILDTLNETVTTADRAKDIYDYNTRVIQKLQQSGNARAALEFQGKVATSELTLAQADHTKFTTMAALSKKVGDMASNALESMQQPGADINKIFYDTMATAKNDLGYTGKVPFSMDPRENIKTLQMLEKNSLTVAEKAELGIKQSVASQKSVMDNAELRIKEEKLNLDKISTGLAMGKENREQATASFNRLSENVKLQFQALNSINSVMDEDYKKALKPSYDANLKALQGYAKVLNVPMPNIAVGTPGNPFASNKTQPGAAPVAAPAVVNPSPNNQPVNNAFPADVLQDAGVASEAGGYVPPTPKTTAQVTQENKTRAATKENIKAQIEALKESTRSAPVRGTMATVNAAKAGYKATAKVLNEAGKSMSDWAVGKDEAEVQAKIKELQKQLDALK